MEHRTDYPGEHFMLWSCVFHACLPSGWGEWGGEKGERRGVILSASLKYQVLFYLEWNCLLSSLCFMAQPKKIAQLFIFLVSLLPASKFLHLKFRVHPWIFFQPPVMVAPKWIICKDAPGVVPPMISQPHASDSFLCPVLCLFPKACFPISSDHREVLNMVNNVILVYL